MITHSQLAPQPALCAVNMIVRDLSDILKRVPPLAPDDSAARAIRVMQAKGVPAVLIAEGNRLIGIVSEADILELATSASGVVEGADMRSIARATQLAEVMQPIPLIALEHQALTELADEAKQYRTLAIPVAASDGRYLGLLLPRDLLASMVGEPVVPPIAGLATPLGVYLTTGALRAGASDLGLVTAGGALMLINLCAVAAVSGVTWLASQFLHGMQVQKSSSVAGLAMIAALYAFQILIFLLLLRLSPLTGIHAAEHMVVRAVEEGEDLTLEKVRQMPRVHPRCGTNLMALVVLLLAAYQLVSSMEAVNPEVKTMALVILIVFVALTWRRLGAGLQRWVTTKRPSDRQLAGAITVAESLLDRVQARPSAPASLRRRIWHTGFLQVLLGFFLMALIADYGPWLASQAWHLLSG